MRQIKLMNGMEFSGIQKYLREQFGVYFYKPGWVVGVGLQYVYQSYTAYSVIVILF